MHEEIERLDGTEHTIERTNKINEIIGVVNALTKPGRDKAEEKEYKRFICTKCGQKLGLLKKQHKGKSTLEWRHMNPKCDPNDSGTFMCNGPVEAVQ